ncbi:MAG: bifunctional (p)ppGpp synthetase/guanosine-3',5'-bis(diphosphate) 3'-pyrophosphohydrolase [Bacteroidaceae bacterium]|nr:bifunctional (p)ppGpp synthetase/guanosine-3',5'-bis(diphosphate) 3'-pyrophosphohydrolase [Bacteroidaceae bacterium]
MVRNQRDTFFANAAKRFSEEEMSLIRKGFAFAEMAHINQKRKAGDPYITHPLAVASIVCDELKLGVNPIIAALLHDVVEDTNHTIDEIKAGFGSDIAFLVDVLTKKKRDKYETSKQVDNFQQMLNSIHYDIRALLIKLADRLHNMRTLKSMKPEKQIKIAGETDYFYAPLANRLGLYKVKSELENLSLQYRSPHEYEDIKKQIDNYAEAHASAARKWIRKIEERLEENGIKAQIDCDKRTVYSIWSKMHSKNISFKEVEHIRVINITFENWEELGLTEKRLALRIYSILTDLYIEKPGSLNNYIDTPKENGYHSLHCKLMGNEGRWMEVHIQSTSMRERSYYGCLVERETGVEGWIAKFRDILKDISFHGKESGFSIESVIRTFYNDDIVVFSPNGTQFILPSGASALDFAYEIHSNIGEHAQYAIINDKLKSIFTKLQHGDRVRIGSETSHHPKEFWLDHVVTYKAIQYIKQYLRREKAKKGEVGTQYILCPNCEPLPGDEVIGFRHDDNTVTIHKCNCPTAISVAAQQGDIIENVSLYPSEKTYPVTIFIKAVNRDGFLLDLITEISQKNLLSIESIKSTTEDDIIDCIIVFYVHSINELKDVEEDIRGMKNIYEVRHITHAI